MTCVHAWVSDLKGFLPRRRFLTALAGTALPVHPVLGAGLAAARGFSFAFMGDTPYNALEELALTRILKALPKDLSFALHVGDIKSGSEECTDQLLTRRIDQLQSSTVPLVMLPGDNEWVDCHRRIAGGFDPVNRLNLWRELARRDQRADKALNLARHPEWPELVHWRMAQAGCSLVGLNIPGTHDGLSDTPYAHQHQVLRNAVNFAWLERAGRLAEHAGDRLLFVAIHANVRLDRDAPQSQDADKPNTSPYFGFKKALVRLMQRFTGQVIVLYGDTHQFRIEHPWAKWVGTRLTSVECFGSPFNGSWIRIDVDPSLAVPKITAQAVL